jgi:hypothetical protein
MSGLLLALALMGCTGSGGWTKEGTSPERTAADLSECRHTAEIAVRRDSNIDTDILATRGLDWQRVGAIQVKRDIYADSNQARSGDIVTQCMVAKGYSTGG